MLLAEFVQLQSPERSLHYILYIIVHGFDCCSEEVADAHYLSPSSFWVSYKISADFAVVPRCSGVEVWSTSTRESAFNTGHDT